MSASARQGGFARIRRYGNPGTPEGRAKGGKKSLETHRLKHTGFNLLRAVTAPSSSAELAELLGIMAGDGHVGEYQATITTSSKTDLPHATFAARLIKRVFGIRPSLLLRKDCAAVVVVISSKEACSLLVRRGATRGHKIRNGVRMPAWIAANVNYQRAFLRGVFDTDGSVYIDQHVIRGKKYEHLCMEFTNRSLPLLADFKLYLMELGFRPTQTTKFAVFLRREGDIRRYFELIGTSNPKHRTRANAFLTKKYGRGVRVVE